ncbi:hypothetical protein B0H14DRAFT_2669515 [Mycena olivaceomarginata]|nr:hypothetical protein B0H14DRAFT_2669515 [Mycena olivaceomarginata]
MTFAQFLVNAGINMSPAVFIAIIAGCLIFVILLVIIVIYVHRRSKRQMMDGAFDKTAFSVVALTHPRPPLGLYQSSPRSSLVDREAQQHDLVGREVRQQEETYMQLMSDLQRPSSRAGTPTLPNQTPRESPFHASRMVQRDPGAPSRSPLTAYPISTSPPPPPPVAVLPPVAPFGTAQLKRDLSLRSEVSTVSEYSVASALRDPQERVYQPLTLSLPTVPASPITPKWPSSPGTYVWPKRQRASQIREELAPETYAKVRWKTDDESTEPAASIPIAQAVPSAPTGMRTLSPPLSVPAPSWPVPGLRINVPPPAHHPAVINSPMSASSAHLYYANASSASNSSTPQQTPRRF